MEVVKTYPGVGGSAWLDLVREEPGKYAVYPLGYREPIAAGFITRDDAEIFVVDMQDRQRETIRVHEELAHRLLEQGHL